MSFLNQLKMLSDLIIVSSIFFILIYFTSDSLDSKLIVYLIVPYVFISFSPVLILHFNYLNENTGIVFEINKNLILKKKGVEILKYNVENISEIIFYMNGAKDTGYGALPYKNYFYAKIKLADESFFIITSLYSSKIDEILKENFKDVKITTNKVFYPMI